MSTNFIFALILFFFSMTATAWDGTLGGVDGRISEADQALLLIPDIDNGKKIYTTKRCTQCHAENGMGAPSKETIFPRIAGQYTSVILKQLSDFRSGNRTSASMNFFALPENIGGKQAMADVAGYVFSLAGDDKHRKGDEADAKAGQAFYEEKCLSCHGASGEGDDFKRVPRLQGQHYDYLVMQINAIKEGVRKRANPDMIKVIEPMTKDTVKQVSAYLSHLKLSAEAVKKITTAQQAQATQKDSVDQGNEYMKALDGEAKKD